MHLDDKSSVAVLGSKTSITGVKRKKPWKQSIAAHPKVKRRKIDGNVIDEVRRSARTELRESCLPIIPRAT